MANFTTTEATNHIVAGSYESYRDTTQDYCNTCKGKCWKGVDNNAETQKAARAMFDGKLPNQCVVGHGGGDSVRCPYANM